MSDDRISELTPSQRKQYQKNLQAIEKANQKMDLELKQKQIDNPDYERGIMDLVRYGPSDAWLGINFKIKEQKKVRKKRSWRK
jgi:hypothetical protein